jgi:hypothetical protein
MVVDRLWIDGSKQLRAGAIGNRRIKRRNRLLISASDFFN